MATKKNSNHPSGLETDSKYKIDDLLEVEVSFEELMDFTNANDVGRAKIAQVNLEKFAQRKRDGRNTFTKAAPFINAVINIKAQEFIKENPRHKGIKIAQKLLDFELEPLENSKFMLVCNPLHAKDVKPMNALCLLCNHPNFFVFMDDYHNFNHTILYSFDPEYFESIHLKNNEGKGLPNIVAAGWIGDVKEKDLEKFRKTDSFWDAGDFVGKKPYHPTKMNRIF